MATALYPGSFDPPHLGHLAVIEHAARTFDELVVAVLGNPAKRSGMFAVPERLVRQLLTNGKLEAALRLVPESIRSALQERR